MERVWEFLTDYDGLAHHLSGLARSRLVRCENGYKVVEQVARPGVPLLPGEVAVMLRVVERPPSRISFEQLEGAFHTFRGSWELAPAGEGCCVLTYRLDVRLRGFIPQMLIEPLVRKGAEEALRQVKAAIERAPVRTAGAVLA
jgi:carbon monoxide dehydrogenase subunit G